MGGETGSDEFIEDDDTSQVIWIPVKLDIGAPDRGDQPTDDQSGDAGQDDDRRRDAGDSSPGTGEGRSGTDEGPAEAADRAGKAPESPSEREPGASDIAAIIAEDPPNGRTGDTEPESETEDVPDPPPQDDEPAPREAREDSEPGRSTEGGPEPSQEQKSDRLWHRLGSGERDTPARSSGSADSASDRRATDRSGQREVDRSEESTGESTEADTAGEGRLWKSRESGPTGSDGGSSTVSGRGGDTTADTEGGETAPPGGDRAPEQGTSFDHLLERSSGSDNPRPVGSPSVETDLDAFFSDLEEFDRATSGSQVLVISPRDHSITDEVCSQFLTAGGVSGRNAMFVTAVESPPERVEICRNNDGWTGGKVAVIELGDTGSGAADELGSVGGEEVVHKRVNSPKNLSRTGLLITQTLKQWSNSEQPSVLCFHTLTAISGYVESETFFQFLFTLQAKLDSLGVTGHYHMDANRHDQQEMNTLKTLFDLVVTISRDGEIEVE